MVLQQHSTAHSTQHGTSHINQRALGFKLEATRSYVCLTSKLFGGMSRHTVKSMCCVNKQALLYVHIVVMDAAWSCCVIINKPVGFSQAHP
jgi:hypothetical protein